MTRPECPRCGVRCEGCGERMCAQYGPEPAVTCEIHDLCTDCDDGTNACRECARVRRSARDFNSVIDNRYWLTDKGWAAVTQEATR